MRFANPLPFVADVGRSKAFYRDVLSLTVSEDHGDFVLFEGGFALHDGPSLHERAFGRPDAAGAPYGRQNLVLYFETPDLEAAFERAAAGAEILHPIRTEPWGGRVFRVLDPDGHVVEVGEAG